MKQKNCLKREYMAHDLTSVVVRILVSLKFVCLECEVRNQHNRNDDPKITVRRRPRALCLEVACVKLWFIKRIVQYQVASLVNVWQYCVNCLLVHL